MNPADWKQAWDIFITDPIPFGSALISVAGVSGGIIWWIQGQQLAIKNERLEFVENQKKELEKKLAEIKSQLDDRVSMDSWQPACDAWQHNTIVQLWQAACLLEDIEPQLPLPRKVAAWYNQLAIALEDGELNNLRTDQINQDSRIKMDDLRKFAEARKLTPRSLSLS
jgi:hypothetical protein